MSISYFALKKLKFKKSVLEMKRERKNIGNIGIIVYEHLNGNKEKKESKTEIKYNLFRQN